MKYDATPATAPSEHLANPKYRADIDGLRAVAVLSVVGFHAFPGWVKGGFIGVDIFFVISGFLISTIILGSLKRNTFSFVEFYSRRIKRIFPALLVVAIAVLAFGWFALLDDEYKQLGKHVAGGAGFISNFILWGESGYFDNLAETKPLLHLWSLGIEEQFYIFWPLFLWLTWKCRFNALAIIIISGAISFILNLSRIHEEAIATFYSPQTRFWELLIGSSLAYMTLYRHGDLYSIKQQLWSWLGMSVRADAPETDADSIGNMQSLLGFALIAISIAVITKESAFPGWLAALPTFGAVLIISSGSRSWFNRVVLSNRVLVWFGLISYPLYLWHWPLLSFARIIENDAPPRDIRIAAVLLSIVLAWLTFRLVEKPIRFGRHGNVKTIVLALFMVFTGYCGFAIFQNDGFEYRVREFTEFTKAAGERQFPGTMKPFTFNGQQFFQQESACSSTTLFIGDSNIEQYYARIDELITSNSSAMNNVIFATGGCCLPVPGYREGTRRYCDELPEKSLELALSRPDISTVVIGAQWFVYLSGNGQYFMLSDGRKLAIKGNNEAYAKAMESLAHYIQRFKVANKRVYLILNIPIGNDLDPRSLVERSVYNFPNLLRITSKSVSLQNILDAYGKMRKDLIEIATMCQIEVIDPIAHLCNTSSCPSLDMDGKPIYLNGTHLRPSFVRSQVSFIDQTVSAQSVVGNILPKGKRERGLGDAPRPLKDGGQ